MSKNICLVLGLMMVLALGFAITGCSREPAPRAGDAVVEESSPSDVPEAFAELSEADRVAALAQKICPVSDQELGSMGTPIKVTVNGRDVFLCCAACKDELLENPDQYLAKLDEMK